MMRTASAGVQKITGALPIAGPPRLECKQYNLYNWLLQARRVRPGILQPRQTPRNRQRHCVNAQFRTARPGKSTDHRITKPANCLCCLVYRLQIRHAFFKTRVVTADSLEIIPRQDGVRARRKWLKTREHDNQPHGKRPRHAARGNRPISDRQINSVSHGRLVATPSRRYRNSDCLDKPDLRAPLATVAATRLHIAGATTHRRV
jgi:hypothetical protein